MIFFHSLTRSKTVIHYFPQCRTFSCFTPQVPPTLGYPLCCHTTQPKFCSLQILKTILRNSKLSRKFPTGSRDNLSCFGVSIISSIFQHHFQTIHDIFQLKLPISFNFLPFRHKLLQNPRLLCESILLPDSTIFFLIAILSAAYKTTKKWGPQPLR